MNWTGSDPEPVLRARVYLAKDRTHKLPWFESVFFDTAGRIAHMLCRDQCLDGVPAESLWLQVECDREWLPQVGFEVHTRMKSHTAMRRARLAGEAAEAMVGQPRSRQAAVMAEFRRCLKTGRRRMQSC